MKSCPACGQPMIEPAMFPRLSPIQRTIMQMLSRAGSAGVTADRLQDAIYADRERWSGAMRTNIYHLRRRLRGSGYVIRSEGWGRREGYRANYWLARE
jgi:DNA-binding winged helix-turn-helix (wHTH) protein